MPSQRQLRLTYDDLDDLALRVHPDNPKRHDLTALDASSLPRAAHLNWRRNSSMMKRIYATKLMGISDADLRRLEVGEQERASLIQVGRIAEEQGIGIDEVLRKAQEIGERIQREGLEAELHRFAQDSGMSEEKARALYEAELEECGL